MYQKNELQFTCLKCSAHELSYQKYSKCTAPVSLQANGHIEYGQFILDEDDCLAALNGFACGSCGTLIEHCGIRLETEGQLIDYLTMEPFDRLHQQQDYQELIAAQIYAQEQQEQELFNQEITKISEDNG